MVGVGWWCRARGNTLLPSTLTLLIGLRVTHSWGCVYVCVFVRARPVLITVTFFPYLHNHEYFALDRVLLVSVGVCVFVARALNTDP